MSKSTGSDPATTPLWSYRLAAAEIPEHGLHLDIEADAATRAALARSAGVISVPALAAHFDVTRHGIDGVNVRGTVEGQVVQSCIITLDPVESPLHEAIYLVFAEPDEAAEAARMKTGASHGDVAEDDEDAVDLDAPEPLLGGVIDLGLLAAEFFFLGIDPYPRKPGAEFDAPAERADPKAHPFAALAALKGDKTEKK